METPSKKIPAKCDHVWVRGMGGGVLRGERLVGRRKGLSLRLGGGRISSSTHLISLCVQLLRSAKARSNGVWWGFERFYSPTRLISLRLQSLTPEKARSNGVNGRG